MKALKTPVFLLFLFVQTFQLNAQQNTASPSQRALLYADSILNAFRYNHLNQYMEMSYPGVVEYYGGKKNYQEYVKRAREMNDSAAGIVPDKTEIVQLVNDTNEWQCVIRKTRPTLIDGKKAFVVSYLVGQSKDEGQSWKYFDVALNSIENLVYIMPDIFDALAVPQRQVVFENDQMAKTQ